jgi:hypothetical protein
LRDIKDLRILKYVEGIWGEDFNCTELSQYGVEKLKFSWCEVGL